MATPIPTVLLNNGIKMPQIGLGTWQMTGDEMVEVVKKAIDIGYRLIDTAYIYGSEGVVGRAIKEKIEEGVVKREDLFVTTKLWLNDHTLTEIIPACRKSLKNLGLEYVDLYLIHWPFAFKSDFGVEEKGVPEFDETMTLEEKWEKMEECVKLGLAKSIGVSNFNSQQVERIVKAATIKPVTNQVECHPNFNQKKFIDFCKELDVVITSYSPLASPGKLMTQFVGDPSVSVLENPLIKQIAEKYNKTSAQVILRYLIELGTVPIPKSSNIKRIAENVDIFDFKLSPSDVKSMDSLNSNSRIFNVQVAKDHRDYPFNIEF